MTFCQFQKNNSSQCLGHSNIKSHTTWPLKKKSLGHIWLNNYVGLILYSDSIQLKIINAESLAFIQEKYLFAKTENVLRWMCTSNQASNTTKFCTCLQHNLIAAPEVFQGCQHDRTFSQRRSSVIRHYSSMCYHVPMVVQTMNIKMFLIILLQEVKKTIEISNLTSHWI